MSINNSIINIKNDVDLSYAIINKSLCSYNNDGEISCMDKNKNTNVQNYQFDNSLVEVERHFNGSNHINEILKRIISDNKTKFTLFNSDEMCYNSPNNTTVEGFSERRSK